MKLWLLTRKDNKHIYDAYDEKVVRAETEFSARSIANRETGDEGKIWTKVDLVACVEIDLDGEEMEILSSFNAG